MNAIGVGRVIPRPPLRLGSPMSSNPTGGLRKTRPTFAALGLLLAFVFSVFSRAAEGIPPAPRNHFNDYAGIVSPATARALNSELTQFERDTSNQIVVAI